MFTSINNLDKQLTEKYPDFSKLAAFSVAVNQEYMDDDYQLQAFDEVAIIPPVSGG